MAVGALEPQFYSLLVSGLELDEEALGNRLDPGEWPRIAEIFSDTFSTRTREGWTEIFDGTDACVTPVLSMDEVAEHPHNMAREALVATGSGPRAHAAPRFSGVASIGHTREMNREAFQIHLASLGLEHETVSEMTDRGILSWD
jgi:alpha-methylacyl-CoA racemase